VGGVPIIAFVSKLFRVSGALLFLLSLFSFAVMYLWRLRDPALDTGTTARDAVLNVALFTVFAMHHSLLARAGAKAWVKRQVPPNLERSVYVWIASLLFLAVCWLWRSLPGVIWQIRGPGLALYLVQLAGVVLTIAAARIVGVWELAGVTQPDAAKAIEFKADGPFGLVRHPIYLGWILMVFATPTMTSAQLLFAVVSTAYLVIAIPWEEALLVDTFGDKYRAYQQQMRWRLVPGLW